MAGGAASYLFLTAKAQNVLAFPIVVILLSMTLYYLVKNTRRVILKALALILSGIYIIFCLGWPCIALYKWNGDYNERQTLYSSLFYGALMLTDTEEESQQMLVDMGLDPKLAADKGHHAYSNSSDVRIRAESEEAEEEIYSKINTFGVLKYYITHPAYLYKAMEVTSQYAVNPPVSWIQFTGGTLSENVVERGRFKLWEENRKYFVPHYFWQYIVVYLLLFSGSVYYLKKTLHAYKKLRHTTNTNTDKTDEENIIRKVFYIILYLSIMIIGILQYPLPFIGNGLADTNKQLYLFMLCWDIILVITICFIICKSCYLINAWRFSKRKTILVKRMSAKSTRRRMVS